MVLIIKKLLLLLWRRLKQDFLPGLKKSIEYVASAVMIVLSNPCAEPSSKATQRT